MARDFNLFKEEIKGKKVAVVGIGVSNIPLINFLVKLGAKVTAFDKREFDALDSKVNEFKDKVDFSLGEDYLEKLTGFDVIFRTPGMMPHNKYLVKAKEEGAIITSEIKEFIRHCKGLVIGVTGADGKSTTTTVVSELLKEEGYKTYLGGNIGFPLFDKIEEIGEDDKVSIELSSFQLIDLDVSPEISIVTNLSPNHLDIHKDMDEYINAKKNIFTHQEKGGKVILNKDNYITKTFIGEEKGTLKTFSSKEKADAYFENDVIYLNNTPIVKLSQMKLVGVHNAENMMAAFLACEGLVSHDTMRKVAMEFNGVKHRAQFIKEIDGVKYYNDSIASSPTRTLATTRALVGKEGKINIILGGYDKNLDYHELAKDGLNRYKNVILCGHSSPKIEAAFNDIDKEKSEKIIKHASNYKEAVLMLKELSSEGDIAILSPASASFDMFKNFEERGNIFVDLVNNLK